MPLHEKYTDKNTQLLLDMYPLYWTTSKEGIFMRYSYEFKLMCVELYHSGLYPDIPEDTNPDTLKRHIREWSGLVDLHVPELVKEEEFTAYKKCGNGIKVMLPPCSVVELRLQ